MKFAVSAEVGPIRLPNKSSLQTLYFQEPAGRFGLGHILGISAFDEDLDRLEKRGVGRWRCDLTNNDALTWTNRVYEIFGLPNETRITREEAVSRYRDHSLGVLERLRTYAINRKCGFILDAEINPKDDRSHWIRILAAPVVESGRVVALHGFKRVL